MENRVGTGPAEPHHSGPKSSADGVLVAVVARWGSGAAIATVPVAGAGREGDPGSAKAMVSVVPTTGVTGTDRSVADRRTSSAAGDG